MTNPDNVGGLPTADQLYDIAADAWDQHQTNCRVTTTAGSLRKAVEAIHRELCRAAPAGGDVTGLHPATADLVARFAAALAEKLAAAERKYGYSDGWASPDWMDECRAKLMEHVAKGDPRDVAAYCAFLWHHGESTATAKVSAPAGSGEVDDAEALREFTEYFVKNYPGPHTVIMDPNWHAPKIFRAAKRALLRKLQQGADYVMVPRDSAKMVTHVCSEWIDLFRDAPGIEKYERYSYEPAVEELRDEYAAIAASQGQEGGHASVD